MATCNRTDMSYRQFCRLRGGHLMTAHPTFGMVDVFAATILYYPFTPNLHVYYAERMLIVRDGLPKLRDFPVAFGGSEEVIPE